MKFLKSKALVGIIVLVAVGLVVKNIMLPLFGMRSRGPSHVVKKVHKKEDTLQQIGSAAGVPLPTIDIDKLSWAINYKRDPFKTLVLKVKTKPEPESFKEEMPITFEEEEEELEVEVEDMSLNHTLVAVVIEPGRHYAVVNDIILREGDYYEGYEVIEINTDSVVLYGPGGQQKLEF